MAFYIVVHHPSDPNRLWANDWEAQILLCSITTPKTVAVRLSEAQARGERIFVHRCAWGTFPAEICCSALVSEVHDLDKTTALVKFTDVQAVSAPPPTTPRLGQSSYDATPPFSNVIQPTANQH
jgi:hypothetical protein